MNLDPRASLLTPELDGPSEVRRRKKRHQRVHTHKGPAQSLGLGKVGQGLVVWILGGSGLKRMGIIILKFNFFLGFKSR